MATAIGIPHRGYSLLASLERYRWLVIGLMAAPLLIGIGVLVDRQLQGPQPLVINLGETPPASEIQVYVAGAVSRPGVYFLSDGDRWIDAVEAAGGPSADADVEAINLARRLQDEGQVLVPRLGEQAALGAAQAPQDELININSAPAAVLDSLSGIGEVRSQNIVDSRERDGPFSRIEELVERKLIPQSVFDQLRELITVGP
ncbi:MAG: helix-hairpin-helix domain-containing protein [Dehalococcoidia bacterium]|nr:helix-hairpin-helix domain-containing protein [Dehalococcoidia bacterium]